MFKVFYFLKSVIPKRDLVTGHLFTLSDFDDVLRTFFSYLDKDGDDAVSVEELTTLADELNLRTYLNDESIKSLFNRLDTNQDRHISYEDFDGLIGLFLNRIFQARIYQSCVAVTVQGTIK